jgi:hypothetical protein
MNHRTVLALFIVVTVLGCCVLSFHQASVAAPPPFANSIEQRAETVELLKEIKELLKEQNALLRSGEIKVVIAETPKANVPAVNAAEATPEPEKD